MKVNITVLLALRNIGHIRKNLFIFLAPIGESRPKFDF